MLAAILMCAPVIRSQDQQQNQPASNDSPDNSATPAQRLPAPDTAPSGQAPVPAARGVFTGGDTQTDSGTAEPDTHPVSGGIISGVGVPNGAHDIFDPALFVSAFGSNGNLNSSDRASLSADTSLGGSLNFTRSRQNYRTSAFYSGADSLVYVPGDGRFSFQNLWYQEAALEQQLTWKRWTVRFRDDFTASPQSAFGLEGLGGPGQITQATPEPGVPLNPLNTTTAPVATILTGRAVQISNTVLGESDYTLSRRSTVTAVASYTKLSFIGSGYINSNQAVGQLGYTHALDPKNSLGLVAGFGRIGFSGSNVITEYELINAVFGRRITGRLAFQITGGPEQLHLYHFVPPVGSVLTWDLTTSLSYELRREGYSLMYSHGVTNGAGVLFSATTHMFTAQAHRRFTRFWTGTASMGYAVNSSVVPTATATNFSDWFAGLNAGRPIGPHTTMALFYGTQKQLSNGACPVASCGNNFLWQTFGVTFTWHPRPINLE